MDFKEELIDLLAKETKLNPDEVSKLLAVPPNDKLGDYAFHCFQLGKNPKEEAEKLKARIKFPGFISKAEASGPYLNIFLDNAVLAEKVLSTVYQEAKNYGKSKIKSKRIVIEYCGPNTNKPLHLGHLRNLSIGNSVCRILEFAGHEVHPVNIVNDRGIHISQSMLAYQKWGQNKSPDKKGDHFVGDFYVLFSQKVKENESLSGEAQQLLVRWENRDKDVLSLWKKMNSWVLDGFKETYTRFGVSFEKEYFESTYYDLAKEIVFEGLKSGAFKKNKEGAIYAPLEKYGIQDKIVLREDNTSIYITQDIYLAKMRFRDFKFDQMIYVVASEQKLHFLQLFKIIESLNYNFSDRLYHLSYGLVHLPSGRMKSREGTVIDADDIMDEVENLAGEEINKRHETLDGKEKSRRAKSISLAAIKFFMLKTDPIKDIIFNPQESMSFEGETGPYLQYAHARACSILRKAKENNYSSSKYINFSVFKEESEIRLLKLLLRFPEIVHQTAVIMKPHYLAQFLLSLSQTFNEFYHQLAVISEESSIMKARLLLVDSVRQTLANGLNLLGIEALEEM